MGDNHIPTWMFGFNPNIKKSLLGVYCWDSLVDQFPHPIHTTFHESFVLFSIDALTL